MKNEKLKTDGDIMVYLINVRRAVAELSKQTGRPIRLYAAPEGYAYMEIGEHEALQFDDGLEICEYRPQDVCNWEHIEPGQANFSGKPMKKPLAPGSNQGLKNNNTV